MYRTSPPATPSGSDVDKDSDDDDDNEYMGSHRSSNKDNVDADHLNSYDNDDIAYEIPGSKYYRGGGGGGGGD